MKINNTAYAKPVSVAVDGKTAVLRLTTALNPGDKYVVQVDDEVLAKPYTSESVLFQTVTAPTLLNTEISGDTLVFTFDKPVANTSTTLVKVDGYALSNVLVPVNNAAKNYKYTVAIDTTNATEKAKTQSIGTHEVILFDVAETSTNIPATASVLNGSYTVTDTVEVAPIVEALIPINGNKFFVQTNQPVSVVANSIDVKKGNHTFAKDASAYNSGAALGTAGNLTSTLYFEQGTFKANAAATAKQGYYVIVTDAVTADINPLYAGSESSVTLDVTVKNYKNANSVLGTPYNGKVTLSKELNKPSVEDVKFNETAKTIDVVLDGVVESADSTSFDKDDIVVRDNKGIVLVEGTDYTLASTAGDTVAITNIADVSKAPFTVEIKANTIRYQKDVSSIAAYQLTGIKNDKLVATAKSQTGNIFKYVEFTAGLGATVSESDNVVTIAYKQKMDDSAVDKANYLLDGKALPAGTTIDFIGDTKTVAITFPENTFKDGTEYRLTISNNIKTEAGEIVVKDLQSKGSHVATINAVDNVKPTLVSATYYAADSKVKITDQLRVTFSEVVDALDGTNTTRNEAGDYTSALDNFEVVVNNTKVDVASIAKDTQDDTDKSFIITLSDAVNLSQAATITVVPEKATSYENVYLVDVDGNSAVVGTSATTVGKEVISSLFSADKAAADAVTIPTATKIDSTNVSTVKSAITTYNSLTAVQKALVVNGDKAAALEAAVVKYENFLAATAKQESTGENDDATQPFDANNDLTAYGLAGSNKIEVDVATGKVTYFIIGSVSNTELVKAIHADGNTDKKVAFAFFVKDVKGPATKSGTFDKIAKYFAQEVSGTPGTYELLAAKTFDTKATVNGVENFAFTIDFSGITITP